MNLLNIISLRRIGSSIPISIQYQAVLDRAITEGFDLPSSDDQQKQNALMIDLVDSGVFQKAKTLTIFSGSNSNFSRIDWADTTNVYESVNSPIYNSVTGFEFDGFTNNLNTNSFIIDNINLVNNHGVSVNQSGLVANGSNQMMFGYRDGFSGSDVNVRQGLNTGGAIQGAFGSSSALTSLGGSYVDNSNYYTTRNQSELISSYEGLTLLTSTQDVLLNNVNNIDTKLVIGGASNLDKSVVWRSNCKIKHFIYAEDMDSDLATWEEALNKYYL